MVNHSHGDPRLQLATVVGGGLLADVKDGGVPRMAPPRRGRRVPRTAPLRRWRSPWGGAHAGRRQPRQRGAGRAGGAGRDWVPSSPYAGGGGDRGAEHALAGGNHISADQAGPAEQAGTGFPVRLRSMSCGRQSRSIAAARAHPQRGENVRSFASLASRSMAMALGTEDPDGEALMRTPPPGFL